jgi:hypothetical protein
MLSEENKVLVIRKTIIKNRNIAIEQHRFHKAKYDDPASTQEQKAYAKNKMQYWGGRISMGNDVYQVFTK